MAKMFDVELMMDIGSSVSVSTSNLPSIQIGSFTRTTKRSGLIAIQGCGENHDWST